MNDLKIYLLNGVIHTGIVHEQQAIFASIPQLGSAAENRQQIVDIALLSASCGVAES